MNYLWLYLGVLIAWIFWTMAEAAQLAVNAVKNGEKDSDGVSILPGILIMPILAVLLAFPINMFWPTIGFWIIGSFHALAGIWALGYIVYSIIYLKRNESKNSYFIPRETRNEVRINSNGEILA